jgi:hypothetical protein
LGRKAYSEWEWEKCMICMGQALVLSEDMRTKMRVKAIGKFALGCAKLMGVAFRRHWCLKIGWVVHSSCSPTRSIQFHEPFIENEGLRTERTSSNSIMSSRYYSQLTHSSRHQLYNHPSLRSIKQYLSRRSFHAQINSHRMLSLLTIPAAMIISLQI